MAYSHNVSFLNYAILLRSDHALWASSALLRLKLTREQREFLTVTCLLSNSAKELTDLIDIAFDKLTFGSPCPPFTSPKQEAKWWSERATIEERKAFLVACFASLGCDLQKDFIEFANEKLQS